MRLTGARATRWSVSSSSCARARSNACSTLLENRETVAMPCEPYLLNVRDHRIAWEWQALIIISAISNERALRHLIQAQGAVAPSRRAIALRVNAGNRKAEVDETMCPCQKLHLEPPGANLGFVSCPILFAGSNCIGSDRRPMGW
jgi:hypothetical protein